MPNQIFGGIVVAYYVKHAKEGESKFIWYYITMYCLYQRIAQSIYSNQHMGTAQSCFIPVAVKSKLPILKTGHALKILK